MIKEAQCNHILMQMTRNFAYHGDSSEDFLQNCICLSLPRSVGLDFQSQSAWSRNKPDKKTTLFCVWGLFIIIFLLHSNRHLIMCQREICRSHCSQCESLLGSVHHHLTLRPCCLCKEGDVFPFTIQGYLVLLTSHKYKKKKRA